MPDGGHRMDKKHSGPGEAHDGANAFPHVWLIAVNLAVGAEGLGLHEGAFVAAHAGIRFQLRTFRAEVCLLKSGRVAQRFMLFLAIEPDHIGDHLLLPLPLVLYLVSFLCIPVQSQSLSIL